jgi:ribonuclease PH
MMAARPDVQVAAQATGPTLAAVVTAALLCAASALAVLLLPPPASSVLSDAAQGVAAVVAAATTARRGYRLSGRNRRAQAALSLGCLSWGLGEAWWT